VPRPPHQASALSRRIRAAGGEPLEAATIATAPGDTAALRQGVTDLADGRLAGVCFTSGNGVRAVAAACAEVGIDPAAAFARLDLLGAVGPRTAELVADAFGVAPTLVPATATGAAMGTSAPAGEGRILLPRGDLAGGDLDAALEARGWTPIRVVAYRTVTAPALPDEVLAALAAGAVDLLAFTAASTVRGFVTLVGDRPWSGRVVSIGPVTSAACRELGLEVAAEADPHDLDGLLAALVRAAGGPVRSGEGDGS
jgi:uroporphyrinogen-III synthase